VRIGTSLGEITFKVSWLGDRAITVTPEFEEVRRIARERGLPVGGARAGPRGGRARLGTAHRPDQLLTERRRPCPLAMVSTNAGLAAVFVGDSPPRGGRVVVVGPAMASASRGNAGLRDAAPGGGRLGALVAGIVLQLIGYFGQVGVARWPALMGH
jgi:hypothetical protein